MELFSASNDEQFNYIKKIIDTCDYYVLIVGGRYGTINPTKHVSFTEQEYEYAVSKNIPVLAFIHNDPQNLHANKLDNNRELLEKFITKVSTNRLCGKWNDINELLPKVITSLNEQTSKNPQLGWIRGCNYDATEFLSQINELHLNKEISEPLKEIKILGSHNSINKLKKILEDHLVWVKSEIFLKQIKKEFTLSKEQINQIANCFRESIDNQIKGHNSTLRMIPSYFRKPNINDKGIFMALDFGSTNLQIMLIQLMGQLKPKILETNASIRFPEVNSSEELFDWIAEQVEYSIKFEFSKFKLEEYFLGHTFSYPTLQHSQNEGTLLFWTKEINLPNDILEKDINRLLTEALEKRNLKNVIPVALLNNTVSTFLAHSYHDKNVSIASICSRYGFNTCYYEKSRIQRRAPMIYNMESGNFYHSSLKPNDYDNLLNSRSSKPEEQRFEKMVGGKYISELIRIVINEYLNKRKNLERTTRKFLDPYTLDIDQVKTLLELDDKALLNSIIVEWGTNDALIYDCHVIRDIAHYIIMRSAQLIAASFLGTIRYIDGTLLNSNVISVDGFLFNKEKFNYTYNDTNFNYIDIINKTMHELEGDKSNSITISFIDNGSTIGAAIAAAIATKDRRG